VVITEAGMAGGRLLY